MKNAFRVGTDIAVDGSLAGSFEYFDTSEWAYAVELADEYSTMVEKLHDGGYVVAYDSRNVAPPARYVD